MTLLIIEDDALFSELVTLTLDARDIMVASTMSQALSMIALRQPDFVVLDLSLPDSNSEHTMSLIREIKRRTKGAIVAVITGDSRPETRRSALESGADHFIEKGNGEKFVRELAARFALAKKQPCANRETVEEIERYVHGMTQTPFSAPPFPTRLLAQIAPMLR